MNIEDLAAPQLAKELADMIGYRYVDTDEWPPSHGTVRVTSFGMIDIDAGENIMSVGMAQILLEELIKGLGTPN